MEREIRFGSVERLCVNKHGELIICFKTYSLEKLQRTENLKVLYRIALEPTELLESYFKTFKEISRHETIFRGEIYKKTDKNISLKIFNIFEFQSELIAFIEDVDSGDKFCLTIPRLLEELFLSFTLDDILKQKLMLNAEEWLDFLYNHDPNSTKH